MKNKKYESIKKHIINSSNIIIMAHKGLDLDALGSSLAFSAIAKHFNKDNYLIIEDKEEEIGVKRALIEIEKRHVECNVVKYDDIKDVIDDDTLLVVLDTHKESLTMNPLLISLIKNIIVIDHHIVGKDCIKNITLKYIKQKIASTSETLVEMLEYYGVTIDSYVATIMLAGTQIDTNNFNIKTTEKTFMTASKLVKYGADTIEVGYLLKQDLYAYLKRQKIIETSAIIKSKFAVGVGSSRFIYDKEELAKASDSLLLFDGIEASFTIARISKDIVGISARSMGNVDVQILMENMGGGGHKTEAAAQISGKDIDSVKEELLGILKKI